MNVSVSLNLNTHIIILEFNMTAAIYTWIFTFHMAYSFICFFLMSWMSTMSKILKYLS